MTCISLVPRYRWIHLIIDSKDLHFYCQVTFCTFIAISVGKRNEEQTTHLLWVGAICYGALTQSQRIVLNVSKFACISHGLKSTQTKADFYKLLLVFIVIARKQEQGKVQQAPSPLHYDCLPESELIRILWQSGFLLSIKRLKYTKLFFCVAPFCDPRSVKIKAHVKKCAGYSRPLVCLLAQDGVMPASPDLVSVVKSPVSRLDPGLGSRSSIYWLKVEFFIRTPDGRPVNNF